MRSAEPFGSELLAMSLRPEPFGSELKAELLVDMFQSKHKGNGVSGTMGPVVPE